MDHESEASLSANGSEQNLPNDSTALPLQCPNCRKVLSTEKNLKKHFTDKPAYCKKAEKKRKGLPGPRPETGVPPQTDDPETFHLALFYFRANSAILSGQPCHSIANSEISSTVRG